MKEWTLTDQVKTTWDNAQDLMNEIKAAPDDAAAEKLASKLATVLAAALYLMIITQRDIKDFVKTLGTLFAMVGAWVTTEITADRPDQIGVVRVEFEPKPPPEKEETAAGDDETSGNDTGATDISQGDSQTGGID